MSQGLHADIGSHIMGPGVRPMAWVRSSNGRFWVASNGLVITVRDWRGAQPQGREWVVVVSHLAGPAGRDVWLGAYPDEDSACAAAAHFAAQLVGG